MNDADENADSPTTDSILTKFQNPTEEANDTDLLDAGEEEDYPSTYHRILQNFCQLGNLFTRDDWINILTHSRGSFEDKLRGRQR